MLYVTNEQLLCCTIPFLGDYHERVNQNDLENFAHIFTEEIKNHSKIENIYVDYPTEEKMETSKLFDVYNKQYGLSRLYLKKQEKIRICFQLRALIENMLRIDSNLSEERCKNIIFGSIHLFNELRVEEKENSKKIIKKFS